jgi:hypothetical protein
MPGMVLFLVTNGKKLATDGSLVFLTTSLF